jgi:hypothetical protein
MSILREQQYYETSKEPETLKSIFNKIKEEIPEFENYYEIWYLTNTFSSKINTVEFNREVNCYNKQYNLIINGENFKIISIIINNKFCNIHYEYITNNKNLCNPIFCFDLDKDIKENVINLIPFTNKYNKFL